METAAATSLERNFMVKFTNHQGVEWEGLIDCDEWIGNNPPADKDWWTCELMEAEDGRRYVRIGASGGGADEVLLRDDGMICYHNDWDSSLSELTDDFEVFLSMLKPLEE